MHELRRMENAMSRPGFTYENRGFDDVARALLSVDFFSLRPPPLLSVSHFLSTCFSISLIPSFSLDSSIGIYQFIYLSISRCAVYTHTYTDASALNDDAACAIAVCVSHDSLS